MSILPPPPINFNKKDSKILLFIICFVYLQEINVCFRLKNAKYAMSIYGIIARLIIAQRAANQCIV